MTTTRSLGALQAPTSSLQPFGPPWLRPSRPSAAQAVWPTHRCIVMHCARMHRICIGYIRCDIFRWRTNGPTNKAILGVGYNNFEHLDIQKWQFRWNDITDTSFTLYTKIPQTCQWKFGQFPFLCYFGFVFWGQRQFTTFPKSHPFWRGPGEPSN